MPQYYEGLPGFVADPARDLLAQQGFPRDSIDSNGDFNAAALLSGVVSEIEVRSNFTPKIVLRTRDLASQGGPPNPLLRVMQPTVVLRGAKVNATIAPYGQSGQGGWLPMLAVVGGLIGFGWWLGSR